MRFEAEFIDKLRLDGRFAGVTVLLAFMVAAPSDQLEQDRLSFVG